MNSKTPQRANLEVVLRDVVESDLPTFYEHQSDPKACAMAAFQPRSLNDFMAHWAKILADETTTKQTILFEGQVVGNLGTWLQDGQRLVGYWIGTKYWGRGIASRALQEFLDHFSERPLFAHVAIQNSASIRVLEKCGFRIEESLGNRVGDDGVEEVELILRHNEI